MQRAIVVCFSRTSGALIKDRQLGLGCYGAFATKLNLKSDRHRDRYSTHIKSRPFMQITVAVCICYRIRIKKHHPPFHGFLFRPFAHQGEKMQWDGCQSCNLLGDNLPLLPFLDPTKLFLDSSSCQPVLATTSSAHFRLEPYTLWSS